MKLSKNYKIDLAKFTELYVKGCLSNEDAENEQTTAQLIIYLKERFKSEFCFSQNLQRYRGNKKELLKEWLLGLPSAIDIYFSYFDIANVLKSFEEGQNSFEELTEDEQTEVFENYWALIAESLNLLSIKHTNESIF